MVDYQNKAPGVYIEEITPAGPIAGVGTSTPALIGTTTSLAPDLTMGKPVLVTNWTQYTANFGGWQAGLNLPYAVRGFFENGGTTAYIVPVTDMTGLPGALDQLTRVPDVSLVAVPGLVDPAAQSTVIAHCEDMRNRFAILDGAPDSNPLKADGPLQKQRAGLLSHNGYAGLYWPWLVISDPLAPAATPGTVTVPPSGHLAGVMARSDAQRGVHKAPANEPVRGAIDLGYPLNDSEQGLLNQASINAIRRFPGGPPLVWGARTLTDGTPWRYVNVRRLVTYLEASILQGVRWAVFEPNNTALWKGLERSISEFLTRAWEAGALFGRTAAQAFYVKIDEELNPPAVRDLGQVIVEIGVAPTRPAEFVIVRLGLWAGGAQLSEG
ncbi:phage tail sheath family protein [Kitasatospora azatica]|uniref:phage tail sheath family protein n=1 Tax=Kitasatospora azatica TaxID=58347 RepID=UPI00055AA919|nr:phage tail sheath subtilisin-like domain-containing protein [Kitasatospora azatica]